MSKRIAIMLGSSAQAFAKALTGKFSKDVEASLQSVSAREAFMCSLGTALLRYASLDQRRELVGPLLQEDGPFSHATVAAELVGMISSERTPEATVLAHLWEAALVNPPSGAELTNEAGLLLEYIGTALRRTEPFHSLPDTKSLGATRVRPEPLEETLPRLQDRLATLLELHSSPFGQLTDKFTNSPVDIRRQIRDYSRLIEDKSRGFVGRQFVFDAITHFISTNPRGYFFLRGDPGIGKTAFAAQLVKTQGCVHHFNIQAEGINRVDHFLRNVCAQLIARYNLDYKELPLDASQGVDCLSRLLNEISDKLQPHERAIIVVDALDEVDNSQTTSRTNILYLPMTLPPSIFIILTTRHIGVNLRVDCEQQSLDLEQDSVGNIADIEQYLTQQVSRADLQHYIASQEIDDALFVEYLVEKSQGNFMYLRYVLPEIERGAYKNLDLDSLPVGLKNYYDDHWRRMRGQDEDGWYRYKLPVLIMLTLSKSPMSIKLLADLHYSPADLSDSPEEGRIGAAIESLKQFLHEQSVEQEGKLEKRWRIYHASFHDFIRSKEEVAQGEKERTAVKMARSMLEPISGSLDERGAATTDMKRFLTLLTDHFNASELRELYFQLGLDYEDLSAGGIRDKALALLLHFYRRAQLPHLREECRRLRPDLAW